MFIRWKRRQQKTKENKRKTFRFQYRRNPSVFAGHTGGKPEEKPEDFRSGQNTREYTAENSAFPPCFSPGGPFYSVANNPIPLFFSVENKESVRIWTRDPIYPICIRVICVGNTERKPVAKPGIPRSSYWGFSVPSEIPRKFSGLFPGLFSGTRRKTGENGSQIAISSKVLGPPDPPISKISMIFMILCLSCMRNLMRIQALYDWNFFQVFT